MVTKELFLEVCVDTVQGAVIAQQAGADRIELCSALETGGVSPSVPLIQEVRRAIQLPLVVLIRSRSGDFFFEEIDRRIMIQEVKQAIDAGADAIAIGGLDANFELDWDLLERTKSASQKIELVVHRAFDSVCDKQLAIQRLIELGYDRILTSGGPNHAIDGIPILRQLMEWSCERIEILPAGGVQASNAETIVKETGCKQVHGSFRDMGILSHAFESRLPRAEWIRSVKRGD